MLVQVEFNTVCEILYEVKAKVKIKALGKRKAKVENKKLGESGSQGMTCRQDGSGRGRQTWIQTVYGKD